MTPTRDPADGENRKVALFDLDDTLIDRRHAFESWLAEFVARHELSASDAGILRDADNDGYTPRDQFFTVAQDRLGVQADVCALMDAYDDDMPRFTRLESGVAAGLDALRTAGWGLGIVTNGSGRMQHGKLASTGLDRLVDCIVVSEIEGVRKPDRAIFEIALGRLGVQAPYAQGWMIGDNLHLDIVGGGTVGLETIWITGTPAATPAGPRPTRTCSTIGEALDYLGRL